jgi:hypothetical protein
MAFPDPIKGLLGYEAKIEPISSSTVRGHRAPSTPEHETMTRSHFQVEIFSNSLIHFLRLVSVL